MAEKQESTLFRKKAMARISSPEDLTSYLRVTSPGMWIVLAAVIALLVGVFAWSAVGTLETTVDATAIVHSHTAQIAASDALSDHHCAGGTHRDHDHFQILIKGRCDRICRNGIG